ncbi:MAG: M6 family metalloprotease domain-containing protein, partial [Candidatus Cloacimonadaceae bacterium]|nr:M6 family metalloprotease domain-containing protein [Candidatus Cloacimonadaceae bacterium]
MLKRHKICRIALIVAIWSLATIAFAMVPPHPKYANPPAQHKTVQIDRHSGEGFKNRVIPNNILVLRVQFSDVTFQAQAQYPDDLPHDTAFFERWMLHLRDFFDDASHSRYVLDYHVYPEVFTLPNPMGYYGGDTATAIDEKVCDIVAHLVAMADPLIDFSSYGGLIIFHAGAGQESDISSLRREQIWSTFITRRDLQNYFDPENDAYPGYPTSDGALLSNIVLVPESQYQDYFPGEGEDNAEAYLFSIYGVLAHQFGHLIGLPTLFDNDSSNGRSQGIGNWGLMGTGVWNGNGYVPAQLSAWSRYYLGWEDAITITENMQNVLVDNFLNHEPTAKRLFKVPISSSEYFLIENRQQNPDESTNPYNGQPSYTFKLLPDGEQDYYDNYPELPYFNFMKNRYIGSEWDFFLPGLGGPMGPGQSYPFDGSGMLIWHIDENIINASFTPNFDKNRVNANSAHKGVDLEEADGIQHLDTAVYDIYKYGSPYDSFRQGNNDY